MSRILKSRRLFVELLLAVKSKPVTLGSRRHFGVGCAYASHGCIVPRDGRDMDRRHGLSALLFLFSHQLPCSTRSIYRRDRTLNAFFTAYGGGMTYEGILVGNTAKVRYAYLTRYSALSHGSSSILANIVLNLSRTYNSIQACNSRSISINISEHKAEF
jgi:hypothetical protein